MPVTSDVNSAATIWHNYSACSTETQKSFEKLPFEPIKADDAHMTSVVERWVLLYVSHSANEPSLRHVLFVGRVHKHDTTTF